MIALETIGYSLAVMIFVVALLLLFMGGPRFRHHRAPGNGARREDSGDGRDGHGS